MVGQQNGPVFKADPELQIIHHRRLRLCREGHANANLLAVDERQTLGKHVAGLQERPNASVKRRTGVNHAGQIATFSLVGFKPFLHAT